MPGPSQDQVPPGRPPPCNGSPPVRLHSAFPGLPTTEAILAAEGLGMRRIAATLIPLAPEKHAVMTRAVPERAGPAAIRTLREAERLPDLGDRVGLFLPVMLFFTAVLQTACALITLLRPRLQRRLAEAAAEAAHLASAGVKG